MKWKIACLQMDITYGQPAANYQAAAGWIEKAMETNPDIIVLPELWTTGYDLTRLGEIADEEAGQTISFFKKLAKVHGVNFIGGSVAKKTDEGIYNTLVVINKDGELIKEYDKLHLFRLMDEHHFLKPGKQDGLFSLDGKTCGGFICYDIRFPEWQRLHSAQGAEVLFVTAEWPLPRLNHWRALLISRAIENQAYVIGVNRAGSDPKNTFAGHSMIIDPWGEIISEAGVEEELLTGTLDFEKVTEARNKIPVFEDRRPDYY